MPAPVQSVPGSIGESRQIPGGRWPGQPVGPEVKRTVPSAGPTGLSVSAGPIVPTRTARPAVVIRAQVQDSPRIASHSGRQWRSLVLPGIWGVWASSTPELSVPPRSGRDRQLRLPPRRRSRQRRDPVADCLRRSPRSGPTREVDLSPPLRFIRTGGSEGLFHVEHQVRDRPRRAVLFGRLLHIRRVGALPGLPHGEDTDPMSARPCGGAGSQTDRRSAYWTQGRGRVGPGPSLANVTRRKLAGVPRRA